MNNDLELNILNCSKGELMKYCQDNDNRIKELDSAIPLETSKYLDSLGLDRTFMVTAYWKNGTVSIIDIMLHYLSLVKGK